MVKLEEGQITDVMHKQGPMGIPVRRRIRVDQVNTPGGLPATVRFTDLETNQKEWTYGHRLEPVT